MPPPTSSPWIAAAEAVTNQLTALVLITSTKEDHSFRPSTLCGGGAHKLDSGLAVTVKATEWPVASALSSQRWRQRRWHQQQQMAAALQATRHTYTQLARLTLAKQFYSIFKVVCLWWTDQPTDYASCPVWAWGKGGRKRNLPRMGITRKYLA